MAKTRKNKLVRNLKKMRNTSFRNAADKLEKFSNPSPAAIRKCEKQKKKVLSMSEEKMTKVIEAKLKKTQGKLLASFKSAAFKAGINDSKLKDVVKKAVVKTRKMMKNMDCKNPLQAILAAMKPNDAR
jgi:hypothetical protein